MPIADRQGVTEIALHQALTRLQDGRECWAPLYEQYLIAMALEAMIEARGRPERRTPMPTYEEWLYLRQRLF